MFLKENSQFPASDWVFWYDKYSEYQAWYSGDTQNLANYYSCKAYYNDNFWSANLENEERANIVHLPAAGDIASMSSNLLFSEKPMLRFSEKSKGGLRLNDIIEENGFYNFLLESAEVAAAFSGVFLKIDIDFSVSKLPLINMVTPNMAIPFFSRGRLFEVLFFREIKRNEVSQVVYRLFENRKRDGNGFIIEFKLYKGTHDKVGNIVDFNSIEETSILNLTDIKIDNVDGLGVIYVPNMRPNKLAPGSPLGSNDFGSVISLMDSLDLAWTSLINDIELGMGQIFVDEELMQREEQNIFGTQKSMLNKFSKFQKCFLNLNLSNYRMGGDNIDPIKIVQFEMRVEEHLKACDNLLFQIVSQCGYSPSTFGIGIEGRAESGTALRIRERKSFLTREKKSRYWQTAIKLLLLQIQQIDVSLNNVYYDIQSVCIELEDSIILDSAELSNSIRNLDQARAISTYTKVKMQHPDWKEEDIENEVKRIFDEEGIEKNSDILNLET